MKVTLAQIGARRHYTVARALASKRLLAQFVTDACAEIPPWSWLDSLIPRKLQRGLLARVLQRRLPEVPRAVIRGFPMFALSAAWDQRRNEAITDRWARRNATFCRKVARMGFGVSDIVYAYNGAALEIFQAARAQGLRTVLDQTAAPWRWNRDLLIEESERWPGWEDQPAEMDSSGRLSAREEQEWTLADHIICGSKFAKTTLCKTAQFPLNTSVIPYPCPSFPGALSTSKAHPTQPHELRLLFVGTLQLRKGLPYLLDALRLLSDPRLKVRLVGPNLLSSSALQQLSLCCDAVGFVPRGKIASHYEWADVFVFPTLSEGSANVVYEALSFGLPVITTPCAGSIIQDQVDGLIVPPRSPDHLAEAIQSLFDSPELRAHLSQNSLKALAAHTPAHYQELLSNLICKL